MTAGRLARRDAPTCAPDEPLRDVRGRLTDEDPFCAVVNADRVVLGRVLREDMEGAPGKTAAEVLHPGPSTFRPDIYISEMADWFQQRPAVDAFIITTPDGRFWGTLYRSDVDSVMQAHQHGTGAGGRRP